MSSNPDGGRKMFYQKSPLQEFVSSRFFDGAILGVIILNCIYLAVVSPQDVRLFNINFSFTHKFYSLSHYLFMF